LLFNLDMVAPRLRPAAAVPLVAAESLGGIALVPSAVLVLGGGRRGGRVVAVALPGRALQAMTKTPYWRATDIW